MQAKITVSDRQTIVHNDPKAAGFTKGYWWCVEYIGDPGDPGDPNADPPRPARPPEVPLTDVLESGAPTREAAEACAAAAAMGCELVE